ncbi:MAG: hypothetical protein J1E60_00965 [Christensenellaceae bacterium]|nr:hypothetical protein [Christensenellaceae bacterium]
MYINTFRYRSKDVACQLCTEYVTKLGCTASLNPFRSASTVEKNRDHPLAHLLSAASSTLREIPGCPWLAERIEAGVVGYREAVMETFSLDCQLHHRFNMLINHFSGSLWSDKQHEYRMQRERAIRGYSRSRDTPVYYAAMYLLTANNDIYRRTANCFCKHGIEFNYAVLRNTSPHNYALFMAARDLYTKTESITMEDLADPEIVDSEALRLIVNATLIARYGLAALQIKVRDAAHKN